MKIGIIGAGQIGGTLTRRLTALGHEVFVANSRGRDSRRIGCGDPCACRLCERGSAGRGGGCGDDSQAHIRNLPKDLFAAVPADVVVVDTATTIRNNATAVSPRSRREPRRAAGWSINSAVP